MEKKRNIIVAVTGASGSLYARLLCRRLAEANGVGRIALIVTRNGLAVSAYEDDPAWMDDPRFTRYDNDDLFGAPASGSSSFDAMVVIPCSMGMGFERSGQPRRRCNAQRTPTVDTCPARSSAGYDPLA